jgi:hypothetical protein
MEVGGGWALDKMVGKEDGGEVLDISGKVIGSLGRYACCFLDIPAIPVFALFQCFLTFQQGRKKSRREAATLISHTTFRFPIDFMF